MNTTLNTKMQKFKSIISGHKLIISFLLSFFCFAVFWGLNGFRFVYGTSDDYDVSLLLSKDPAIPFVGYFITVPISFLQKFAGSINLYVLFELILSYISISLINYVFMLKSGFTGICAAVVFDLFIIIPALIIVQFTHVSVLCCSAGLFLVLYCINQKHSFRRTILFVIGGLLIVIGSQYRFISFKLSLVLFFICFIILFGYYFIKLPKGSLLDRIVLFIKSYGKRIFVILIIILLVFGINTISDLLKFSVEGYKELRDYNVALSSVQDYDNARYEGNEPFYNSIGVNCENDITSSRACNIDQDYYNVYRLNQIGAYSLKNANNGAGNKTSVSLLFEKMNSVLSNQNKSIWIVILISAPLMVLLGFLIIKYRKRKAWGSVILAIIWYVLFILYLNNRTELYYFYLLFPVCVIGFILSLSNNILSRNISYVFSFCSIALFFYLYCSRINFRGVYGIMVSIICILFFSLNPRALLNYKQLKSKKLAAICFVFLLICAMSFSFLIMKTEIVTITPKSEPEIIQYIKKNNDKVFIRNSYGIEALRENYDNPILLPKNFDNVVAHSGWSTKSITKKEILKRSSAEHFFKDIINSNRLRFIFRKGEEYDIQRFTEYINNHYSKAHNVKMIDEATVGACVVCKVIEE